MSRNSSFFLNFDRSMLISVFLLICIGLVSLWSLSIDSLSLFYKQIFWAVIGGAVFVFASVFDYRIFRNHGGAILILYGILMAALASLIIFNIQTRGVAGWFKVEGITIQPVEFMKIILIILLAKYFSKRHVEIYQFRHIIISGLYVLVPIILVVLQPDLGSAIVIISLWCAITVWSGIKAKHFIILLVLFSLISGIGWVTVLKDYQRARIISFLNPYSDPRGAGYNTIQSLIAVGSGGVWGKGLGQGPQSHLLFLPEAETDFIFAAFAEEWGLVGNIILLSIYAILLFRILKIGRISDNNFAKLFTLGFATLIFSQVLIHIGMNIGLLPVTGITLPFVSYGGSSLITLLYGVGIVQSIAINSRRELK